MQNTDPPTCHSLLSSNNGSEQRFLVNPKGSQKQTKVFSRIFEDSACRPIEQRVLCGQCLALHPLHNQDPCVIFFVTEDHELASGHKSHKGGPYDSSFRDQLEAAGIKTHETIHIKFILVNDGGAFANNTDWLAALLAREWVNLSKRGGKDGIFQGLAGLLRGISRSSPASQRKTSQDINVWK